MEKVFELIDTIKELKNELGFENENVNKALQLAQELQKELDVPVK